MPDPSRQTNPDMLPAIVQDLRKQVTRLHLEASNLRTIVGRPPNPDETGQGSGLAGAVSRLELVLGRAPNDATGDPGDGLLRVVAQINLERRGGMSAAALMSAGGGSGAIVMLIAYVIAKLFHLPM